MQTVVRMLSECQIAWIQIRPDAIDDPDLNLERLIEPNLAFLKAVLVKTVTIEAAKYQ